LENIRVEIDMKDYGSATLALPTTGEYFGMRTVYKNVTYL